MSDSINHARPQISAIDRRHKHAGVRDDAKHALHSQFHNPIETAQNADENTYQYEYFVGSFTKGLLHNEEGMVERNYPEFVNQINQIKAGDFKEVKPAMQSLNYHTIKNDGNPPDWRGWESPRTGHYFDLEGTDCDGVGLAPPPILGEAELAFEMAEVYAMAMLRDIPFGQLSNNASLDTNTEIPVTEVLEKLNSIWQKLPISYSTFTKRRYAARVGEPGIDYDVETGELNTESKPITVDNLFRGSGPGAKSGPWISQFMLVGDGPADQHDYPSAGHRNETKDKSDHLVEYLKRQLFKTDDSCAMNGADDDMQGFITYGNQVIDQRCKVFAPHLDYMLSWAQWRDVQNGADVRGQYIMQEKRRFLTTPRDMATYVRFDALYQAYLNACLILLKIEAKTQTGFPEQGDRPRTPFASFGGPHILSLVTEVATRCLKSARRQKFNFHRRPRPERIGGLLTLAHASTGGAGIAHLGPLASKRLQTMLGVIGDEFIELIATHNLKRSTVNSPLRSEPSAEPGWFNKDHNLLLAMAFPEGSPMHPAYAAGHATVAGGCVTMLKAFFQTVDENFNPIEWKKTQLRVVQANDDGTELIDADGTGMTLEGELNKLAANVSIARNMAGVHYYSDYYDSLRMGERIAVSILVEQLETYDTEEIAVRFRSFDGDTLLLNRDTNGVVSVVINAGKTSYRDWWYRHMEESVPRPAYAAGD